MPSSARALASGPQSTARPATSLPARSSASCFATCVVAADERVLVGRRLGEVRGGERVQAGGDGRVELVLDPLRDRGRLGRRLDAAGAEGELGADREDGRRADRLAQLAGGLDRGVGLDGEERRGRRRGRRRRSPRPSAPSGSAASRARSASREPITTSTPASTSRFATACPKLPVPPTTATLTLAAPSAASARRRDASRSVISVLRDDPAALRAGRPGRTRPRRARRSDPRSSPRRAPESCPPPSARAYGLPGP